MSNQNPPPGDQGNQGWGNPGDQGSENPYAAPSEGQQGYGGGQQGQPQQYGQSGGYQQGGYGQQSSGGSGLAITALVLGILSIIGAFFLIGGYLLGIPAIIVGAIAASKAKKGTAQGRGMAIGGLVTGVIGLLISIGITVAGILFVTSETGGNYVDCVANAVTEADVEQCAQEFLQ